jgi:hypothetical protein
MSLAALASVKANPSTTRHIAQFRHELRQARTGSAAFQVRDHWMGLVRGLHMAGGINRESRDALEAALEELTQEHAVQIIERMRAMNQETPDA